MKRLGIVLLGILTTGCSPCSPTPPAVTPVPATTAVPECDTVREHTAALHNFPASITRIYVGSSREELAQAVREVERIATWAERLEDPCSREAYLSWVRHYRKWLVVSEAEIERWNRALERADAMPKPPR